jgi:hypothetical protein
MAVEHGKSMVFTVEHRQTLARVSETNASAFVCWGAIAQSRSVIDYAYFQHCAAYATFDANRASLLARGHRVFQGIFQQWLQQ